MLHTHLLLHASSSHTAQTLLILPARTMADTGKHGWPWSAVSLPDMLAQYHMLTHGTQSTPIALHACLTTDSLVSHNDHAVI